VVFRSLDPPRNAAVALAAAFSLGHAAEAARRADAGVDLAFHSDQLLATGSSRSIARPVPPRLKRTVVARLALDPGGRRGPLMCRCVSPWRDQPPEPEAPVLRFWQRLDVKLRLSSRS